MTLLFALYFFWYIKNKFILSSGEPAQCEQCLMQSPVHNVHTFPFLIYPCFLFDLFIVTTLCQP